MGKWSADMQAAARLAEAAAARLDVAEDQRASQARDVMSSLSAGTAGSGKNGILGIALRRLGRFFWTAPVTGSVAFLDGRDRPRTVALRLLPVPLPTGTLPFRISIGTTIRALEAIDPYWAVDGADLVSSLPPVAPSPRFAGELEGEFDEASLDRFANHLDELRAHAQQRREDAAKQAISDAGAWSADGPEIFS